jgi:hypothetical protein
MTQVATRLYVHGTGKNQRSTAYQLTTTVATPQRIVDRTIEHYDARDIVQKNGRYGILFLIRSTFCPHRYWSVSLTKGGYKCTCGDEGCKHIKQANGYLKSQEVA